MSPPVQEQGSLHFCLKIIILIIQAFLTETKKHQLDGSIGTSLKTHLPKAQICQLTFYLFIPEYLEQNKNTKPE